MGDAEAVGKDVRKDVDKASFVTGADLAVDGGYDAIGPEAMGQPFEKVPVLPEE